MSLVDALMLPSLQREAGHSNAYNLPARPHSQAMEKKSFGLTTATTMATPAPISISTTPKTTEKPASSSSTDQRPVTPRILVPESSFVAYRPGSTIFIRPQEQQERTAAVRRTMMPTLKPFDLSIDTDVPPALPARSALRASHMLASPVDLKAFAAATAPAALTQAQPPHEVYLSSEEDASSSADDFSDYECESPSECEVAEAVVQQIPEVRRRRSSQQESAKMVSIVYSGRPSIVTLSPSRASFPEPPSSSGSDSAAPAIRPLARAATDSSLGTSSSRRLSVASTSTTSSIRHPPRSSSMYMAPPPTSSGSGSSKKKPSFLNIDPFATNSAAAAADAASIREEDQEAYCESPAAPRTPKTPSAMFRRGLSLVRKRSRPLLSSFGGPVEPMPLPTIMPTLHIQTAGPALERCDTPTLQTPMSAVPFPYSSGYDMFNKPMRKVSTPVSTPLSPMSTATSPARNKGRLLGFRRQSLSFKGMP